MPRIAFVHFYTFRLLRGIETHTINLANALVEVGVDVSILTAKRSFDPPIIPDPRIHVHEFNLPRYFERHFIAPQYLLILLRKRFDYVIVFFADFGEALAWNMAKLFVRRTRLLVYLCYPYAAAPHRYRSLQSSGLLRDASVVLALTQHVAE